MTSKETNLVMWYKVMFSFCCKLDSKSLYFILCLYCRSTVLVQSSRKGKVVSILEEKDALPPVCVMIPILITSFIELQSIKSFSANQVTLALCVTLIWHLENVS